MNTALSRPFAVIGLCLACVLAVAACSNAKDDAYKNSKAPPPLEVPPDLIKPGQDDATAIPDLPETPAQSATATTMPPPVAAAVPAAAAKTTTATLHIERQGTLRWLVVPAPVDQVWQRTKDFLVQKGFAFAKEDEQGGYLETEWRGGGAQPADQKDLDTALQSGLQDKYKLRIETGRVAGTSEVSVSHLGLQRVVTNGKPEWQPRAADPMLEADLLDQLRDFFKSEGTAVVAPANDMPAVKAKVSTDATTHVATLTLDEDFDRAWRRIGLALGRGGFVVEDRNRSEGLYLIRLGTAFKEDASAGFVARLFGANAGDPNERYRVHVKDRGDICDVIVEHPGGAPVHTSIGGRILNRLTEKME